MNKSLFLVLLSLILSGKIADAQLTIDGQFRTRAELRDGYRELASDQNYAAAQVSQRSRLTLSFNESDFQFKFSAQDARVWGENWNQMPSNTIHIHEAWAAYKPSPNFLLKLGRQELRYDDQRLMAARNYSITGVTYDAALLIYNNVDKGLNFHLGAMVNNQTDSPFLTIYNPLFSFKYMSFLWVEKMVSDNFKFNVINFFDLSQNPADPHIMYARNTVGGNTIFSFNEYLGGRLGGYYQFGEHWMNFGAVLGESKIDVSAHSYNASLWAKPIPSIKVSLNIDTHSGNDWSSNSNKFSGFNRLMSAGHAYLGYMDYFTSMDLREVLWAGINDYFIRIDYTASTKLSLQASVHYFLLNKPFFPIPGPIGYVEVEKGLGTELDIVASYKLNKILTVEAGLMTIFPTETLESIKLNGTKAQTSYFSYISLLFTPRFLEWQKPNPVEI